MYMCKGFSVDCQISYFQREMLL